VGEGRGRSPRAGGPDGRRLRIRRGCTQLHNIRDLPDGPEDAAAYHERLRGGGIDVTPAGVRSGGRDHRLKDTSFIIWRPRFADGTPALEFDISSRGKVKLRYQG
jgi:hypothetical protein